MKICGRFRIIRQDGTEEVVQNAWVSEGVEALLKMFAQGNNVIVAAAANFYIGLCTGDTAANLAAIATEPSAAGGYARQGFARSVIGVPTIDTSGGTWRFVSTVETFAATGADYSVTFDRLFLCSVAAGTAGILFAYTAALAAPIQISDGELIQVVYEGYME